MRRSRLYLTLSIVSLMVAIGVGVANKNCNRLKQLFRHDCKQKVHAQKQKKPEGQAEIAAMRAHKATWDAFRARDFDRMAQEATLLTDSEGKRLLAYALRGQGRYDEAAEAYTEVLVAGDDECATSEVSSVRLAQNCMAGKCDAYIGRAHCWQMLGDEGRAGEDILAAQALSRKLINNRGNEGDHYQLACAYAVEAGMLKGPAAEVARRKAVDRFILAVELGYNHWDHIAADLDLDSLREDPQFARLVP